MADSPKAWPRDALEGATMKYAATEAGPAQVVVVAAGDESGGDTTRRRAAELATRLRLPQAELTSLPVGALALVVRPDRLELRDPSSRAGAMVIDFAAGARGASKRGTLSRREPLGRAMGGGKVEHVLDATAGLGGDAARLARMGYRVTAVERSPVLAALLDDALERARRDPALREVFGARLKIIQGDAREILQRGEVSADAVYIDPMFPPKKRASALPRKEIIMLRALVGDDEDAAELLAIARENCARVIVKRPTHAPPLAPKPTAQIESKLARFDVYVQEAGNVSVRE